MFFSGVLFAYLLEPVGQAIYLLILLSFLFSFVKRITKGLEKSTEKFGFAESYQISARAHNWITLIFSQIASIGFVALGISLLHTEHWPIAVAGIVCFGLGGIISGYIWRVGI